VNNILGTLKCTFNSLHAGHFQQIMLKVFQLSTLHFQLSTYSVESVSTFNRSFAHGKNRLFWPLQLVEWRVCAKISTYINISVSNFPDGAVQVRLSQHKCRPSQVIWGGDVALQTVRLNPEAKEAKRVSGKLWSAEDRLQEITTKSVISRKIWHKQGEVTPPAGNSNNLAYSSK
jgi:hypothetical protein